MWLEIRHVGENLKNPTKEESKFFLTDVYSVPEFSLSTMFRGMEFRWISVSLSAF